MEKHKKQINILKGNTEYLMSCTFFWRHAAVVVCKKQRWVLFFTFWVLFVLNTPIRVLLEFCRRNHQQLCM